MASGFKRLICGARDLIYPPKCSACRALLPWRVPSATPRAAEAFCKPCLLQWEEATDAECGVCGAPVRECLCMPELLKRSKCRALCKLVYYVPGDETHASNRLIYHIKRNNDSKTPRFLSAQLLPVLSMLVGAEGIDVKDCVITYVPRSRRAYLEHGTDQSKELARCLGEDLGMPTRALIKRDPKSNQAQKTLTPIEREKNARESFLPMGDECFCEGKSVFLVDDVVTTGASMARCVRLLRKMGARRVWCICIASDHVNRDLCVRAEI